MNEKKGVSRRVFIGLEIACVILIACLVGATSSYSLQISDKDNTISSVNYQTDSLNFVIRDQNNTISSLNTQLATLQEQCSNIHILGTENSAVWIDSQTIHVLSSSGPELWPFSNVSSSGYISVLVSSNNNSTYAGVLIPYTFNYTILNNNQTIHLGFDGTAIFPIPPGLDVFVEVGTSAGEGTVTLTAIYSY
jgi:hypothetical protein